MSDVCEAELDIASIACDTHWVVEAQIRLFAAYLTDSYELSVYDNSRDVKAAWDIEQLCASTNTRYVRVPLAEGVHHMSRPHLQRLHEHALRHACDDLLNRQAPVIGFVDDHVFPSRPTSILALVEPRGFFGIGQRHPGSGLIYLWPGFLFFSRAWLPARPDFGCLEHGDTGSKLANLVTPEEVAALPQVEYGYEWIRQTDGRSHSDAVERVGDFVHLTNTTRWNSIPDCVGRDQLVRRMVADL